MISKIIGVYSWNPCTNEYKIRQFKKSHFKALLAKSQISNLKLRFWSCLKIKSIEIIRDKSLELTQIWLMKKILKNNLFQSLRSKNHKNRKKKYLYYFVNSASQFLTHSSWLKGWKFTCLSLVIAIAREGPQDFNGQTWPNLLKYTFEVQGPPITWYWRKI